MHEIKRLIAEKEKWFALSQKTVNDNPANLTSVHISDRSELYTDIPAKPLLGISKFCTICKEIRTFNTFMFVILIVYIHR